jgi:predicted peptidase
VQIAALSALLDNLAARYRVDQDRVYVTGLSMGGFGAWQLAVDYPARFAAIAPVCGKGEPAKAQLIKDLPIWVFHGAKDPVVPVSNSQDMVDALKKCGSDVKLTIYPEALHDSWTETYNNPELYNWFLQHKRGGAK